MHFKLLLVTHSTRRLLTFLWPMGRIGPPFFIPGSEEDWLTSVFPPGFSPHSSSLGLYPESVLEIRGFVCMEEFCFGKGLRSFLILEMVCCHDMMICSDQYMPCAFFFCKDAKASEVYRCYFGRISVSWLANLAVSAVLRG